MHYKLYREPAKTPAVAEAERDDDYAAEDWAKAWARDHDIGQDYRLERDSGDYRALLFCTKAGQQYIMRQ